MKPVDRYKWLKEYISQKPYGVDILDAEFVQEYINATNAQYRVTIYGAFKCAQLGRDLAAMHHDYVLKRNRVGIEGMGGMGFPTWVWNYQVHPAFKERA